MSDSSSDSDLFPGSEYVEDLPLKPEIAEIGTKSLQEVLGELKQEAEKEVAKPRPQLPTLVSIEEKLQALREEAAEDQARRHKQLRGKDDPSATFKRPKLIPKRPF